MFHQFLLSVQPITTYKHPTHQSSHKGLGTILWWHWISLQHLRSSNTQLIGWWAKLSGILHQRPYKAGFEVLHKKKKVCLSHNSVQTDVSCQPVSMQSCFLGEIMGNHDFLLSGALSTNQHFTRCTNSGGSVLRRFGRTYSWHVECLHRPGKVGRLKSRESKQHQWHFMIYIHVHIIYF